MAEIVHSGEARLAIDQEGEGNGEEMGGAAAARAEILRMAEESAKWQEIVHSLQYNQREIERRRQEHQRARSNARCNLGISVLEEVRRRLRTERPEREMIGTQAQTLPVGAALADASLADAHPGAPDPLALDDYEAQVARRQAEYDAILTGGGPPAERVTQVSATAIKPHARTSSIPLPVSRSKPSEAPMAPEIAPQHATFASQQPAPTDAPDDNMSAVSYGSASTATASLVTAVNPNQSPTPNRLFWVDLSKSGLPTDGKGAAVLPPALSGGGKKRVVPPPLPYQQEHRAVHGTGGDDGSVVSAGSKQTHASHHSRGSMVSQLSERSELSQAAQETLAAKISVPTTNVTAVAQPPQPESQPRPRPRQPPQLSKPMPKKRESAYCNISSVKNALTNVCLAGVQCMRQRDDLFAVLDAAATVGVDVNGIIRRTNTGDDYTVVKHFVVLLYSSIALNFKGVYGLVGSGPDANPGAASSNVMLVRLSGKGPRVLPTCNSGPVPIIENFHKYDNASRGFCAISGCKSISSTIDAISINPNKILKK